MASPAITNYLIANPSFASAGPGLPCAYANLEVARQRHGARADKYVALLWRADPLADAVVEVFATMAEEEWRQMLDRALERGIDTVPNAPEPLRRLFAQLDHVPFWVDRDQCNLGGFTFIQSRFGVLALGTSRLAAHDSRSAGT